MVSEGFYDRAEVVVTQCAYFFIPCVQLSKCLCRRKFLVENGAQLHGEGIRGLKYRMMFEQYIHTMSLYVSPFVLRHHQRVLASGEYLTHGLAIGICDWRQRFVTVVFLCYKLAADVDADFINGLVVHLLNMETVVDHMSVVEDLRGNEHH